MPVSVSEAIRRKALEEARTARTRKSRLCRTAGAIYGVVAPAGRASAIAVLLQL
ncbi:hypothetical protein QUA27_11845 [Microcoleus sp. Pol14C6]|uniref:hypothetical protein n=1 Tax=unclassified Microcoleus TaxID=2642155 RepID=UPI002FD67435